MNILVVGCGKVGSGLANILSRMGHDVVVVDREQESFGMLDDDFDGFTVTGVPIDQDVLKEAGIEGCDALAAVTPDDNMNAMVCQIAKEIFKVPRVLSRIYDPQRESVFTYFDVKTICPTNLTVSAVYSMLTDRDQTKHLAFDDTVLSFSTVKIPRKFRNMNVMDIVNDGSEEESLFGVLNAEGKITLINGTSYILKEDDRLIYAQIVD